MRALVLVLIAASVQAQSLSEDIRQPWQWTLEDRLKERFDPISVREREAAALAADPRETSGSPNRTDDIATISKDRQFEYRIDGRRNPELFLTFELFDSLMLGLSPDEAMRAPARQRKQKVLRSLGFDEAAFWTRLESVSLIYLETQERVCTTKECADARCAARFDAMEAARKLFGTQEFDRMLYLAVAPALKKATATLDRNHRAALQREELGCR